MSVEERAKNTRSFKLLVFLLSLFASYAKIQTPDKYEFVGIVDRRDGWCRDLVGNICYNESTPRNKEDAQ